MTSKGRFSHWVSMYASSVVADPRVEPATYPVMKSSRASDRPVNPWPTHSFSAAAVWAGRRQLPRNSRQARSRETNQQQGKQVKQLRVQWRSTVSIPRPLVRHWRQASSSLSMAGHLFQKALRLVPATCGGRGAQAQSQPCPRCCLLGPSRWAGLVEAKHQDVRLPRGANGILRRVGLSRAALLTAGPSSRAELARLHWLALQRAR